MGCTSSASSAGGRNTIIKKIEDLSEKIQNITGGSQLAVNDAGRFAHFNLIRKNGKIERAFNLYEGRWANTAELEDMNKADMMIKKRDKLLDRL